MREKHVVRLTIRLVDLDVVLQIDLKSEFELFFGSIGDAVFVQMLNKAPPDDTDIRLLDLAGNAKRTKSLANSNHIRLIDS